MAYGKWREASPITACLAGLVRLFPVAWAHGYSNRAGPHVAANREISTVTAFDSSNVIAYLCWTWRSGRTDIQGLVVDGAGGR